jgi:hypothetical protein
VEAARPISGVLVLPKITSPARRKRAVSSLSWSTTLSLKSALPKLVTAPE